MKVTKHLKKYKNVCLDCGYNHNNCQKVSNNAILENKNGRQKYYTQKCHDQKNCEEYSWVFQERNAIAETPLSTLLRLIRRKSTSKTIIYLRNGFPSRVMIVEYSFSWLIDTVIWSSKTKTEHTDNVAKGDKKSSSKR